MAAVSRVGASAVQGRLRAALATSLPRVPYSELEREAWLTQAVLAQDAYRKLFARICSRFTADSELFELPPERRKDALLRAFRRIAAAAVGDEPVDCAPPTLKMYAASK